MAKRVYRVVGKDGTESLVKTSNQASARSAIARDDYTVEVASQDDLVRLIKAGVEVQEVGEDEQE